MIFSEYTLPCVKTPYTETDLCDLAQSIAEHITCPQIICLYGDLGAGKSTFARAFIRTMMKDAHYIVPSPTFTLVQEYAYPKGTIFHYDLYRLGSEDELIELNIEEALHTGICLIEWPQKLGSFQPQNYLSITLEHIDNHVRNVTIEQYI